MYKSRLIQVLKTFSIDELKEFRDFVNSPYHNKNKSVIRLYEIIRKQGPNSDSAFLKKEITYSKLYPGKEYNDIVMRILMSDLLKIAEDYLVQLRIEKCEIEYNKYLLKEFMDRRLDKMFMRVLNEAKKLLEDCRIDDEYFRNRFDIEELYKGFNIARNRQHLNSANLVRMGELVLNYFLIKMSSTVHDIKVNETNFNMELGNNIADQFINIISSENINHLLKEENFEGNDFMEIYYCALKLNDGNDTDNFYQRLRALFYKNIDAFTHEAKYNMYMALLNYCGKKHWMDREDIYKREQLQLFKDMLSKGLYSWAENDYMTIIIFRSIITLSTMLGETDWMEYFIANYKDKLAPEHRENMYHFSSAKLYFARKNYELALQHISKVNYELFNFKYDVKSLMLQIYYELNYIEEAYNLIDTFKHFLINNKNVSQVFKDWNINFLSFYQDILNIKSGKNNVVFPKLKTKVIDTPNIASKKWLLEKIREIDNNEN